MSIKDKPPNKITIPRWLALLLGLFVWLVGIPLAHGALPWAISLLTQRHGWSDGHPEIWNWLGLIPVIFAAAWLIWIMILGFAETPERVALEWNSPFLLRRGPYAFTRNPMYVAELGLWLAWAIFYGSLAILLGFVILVLGVNYIVLPREERALEARFGDAYRHYKSAVPRWFRVVRG